MALFVIALFGSAISNSYFFHIGSGSANVLNLFIGFSALSYLTMYISNRKAGSKYGPAHSGDSFLWGFFFIGALSAILSYFNFYSLFASDKVLFNRSFVPRQAYYLFFIPLIILASRHYQTPKILAFLKGHYRVFFIAVYISYLLVNRTIAIDVPCSFCLSLLLLLGRDRNRVIDIALLLVIEFSPIDVGGEMTQMICRALCLIMFVAPESNRYLKPMMLATLIIVLVCYVLPFIPMEWFGLDANTSWRLNYWRDELIQLFDTFGIGVGYGTSYATRSFIGEALSGPFAATAEYSAMDRLYVVGCHNSFVSIAFRLGVIGVGLLLAFILKSSGNKLPENRCNYLTYITVSSVFIVCFNVGFESPMYFFLFAFAFATLGAMSDSQMELTHV